VSIFLLRRSKRTQTAPPTPMTICAAAAIALGLVLHRTPDIRLVEGWRYEAEGSYPDSVTAASN
jgi:hypothetical protein